MVVECLAETEIAEFYLAIMEHDVTRLEVAVNDVFLLKRLECDQQLPEVDECLPFVEDLVVEHNLLQRPTVAKLVDEIVIPAALEHLDKLHNMWILDAC